tara:strand:+ start:525 stop:653 length:129 start_codon:yes stop_codon:yes gene_type:complete
MSGIAIGVKLESRLAITDDRTSDVIIKKMRLFDNCIEIALMQ